MTNHWSGDVGEVTRSLLLPFGGLNVEKMHWFLLVVVSICACMLQPGSDHSTESMHAHREQDTSRSLGNFNQPHTKESQAMITNIGFSNDA